MAKNCITLLLIWFVSINLVEAHFKSRIVKGVATESSFNIWLMLNNSKTFEVFLVEASKSLIAQSKVIQPDESFCYKGNCSVNILFENLKPGTKYLLKFSDNVQRKKPLQFTTKSTTTAVKDFSIIAGSCGFTPFGLSKLLFPFINLGIYDEMKKTKSDFMLWLGDTVYYIRDDNKSRKVRRNMKYRQKEKLVDFLESTPQIAMWDDHDFGPNNADGSYKNKDATQAVFNNFWPNPTAVENDGIYFKVSHFDVDFFILDNRSYSTKCTARNASILGATQKAWLKDNLKTSTATFKIICSGNQFVADYLSDKTFALYPEERSQIFNFLIDHKIEGVFFLTGDRHHTEILKREVEGLYPMLEYSCSPISSWPNAKLNSLRFNKQQRVAGTLVNKRNFGKLSFSGDSLNRKCLIETIDKRGKLQGKFEIDALDLRF